MPTAQQARIERLMECWRMVLNDYDTAKLRDDDRRRGPCATLLKVLDALIYAEEGNDAELGAADQRLMGRLREIAAVRDILAHERPAPADAAEIT